MEKKYTPKERREIYRTGAKNSRARKVIHTPSGIVYGCIKDAAKDLKTSYTNMISKLSGKRFNNLNIEYYE